MYRRIDASCRASEVDRHDRDPLPYIIYWPPDQERQARRPVNALLRHTLHRHREIDSHCPVRIEVLMMLGGLA